MRENRPLPCQDRLACEKLIENSIAAFTWGQAFVLAGRIALLLNIHCWMPDRQQSEPYRVCRRLNKSSATVYLSLSRERPCKSPPRPIEPSHQRHCCPSYSASRSISFARGALRCRSLALPRVWSRLGSQPSSLATTSTHTICFARSPAWHILGPASSGNGKQFGWSIYAWWSSVNSGARTKRKVIDL